MMEEILYWVAYCLSTFLEFYIISKFMKMFLGEGNRGKVAIIAVYTVRFVVCTLQYINFPHGMINMLCGVITLFIVAFGYGGKVVNKLVACIITYFFFFASEAAVAAVLALSNVEISVYGHNGDMYLFIVLAAVQWITYEIVISFKNINSKVEVPRVVNIIIIVIDAIIFALETAIFSQNSNSESIKILSVICMLLVIFLVVYLYDIISISYAKKMEADSIEREKNYYLKQTELLQARDEQLRDFRHDINNHLYVIGSMIGSENEEAKKYIENLTEKIITTKMYSNTGNVAIDSVINYELSKAEKQDIKTNLNIVVPSGIQNDVENLVTIFGNLLDNAIEAADKCTDEKYIDLKVRYKRGAMFIDIKNSYDGVIVKRKNRIVTKKQNKNLHGIGLKSVEAAVNNYNGTMKLDFNEKEFKVSIMLYI